MLIEQIYTFDEVEKLVGMFESVLNRNGITIKSESELERLCLQVTQLHEFHKKPELRDPNSNIQILFRDLTGIQDLMSKLVSVEASPHFHVLIPHLHLLNEGSPLQNYPTLVTDQQNNKLFELYIATLCLAINPQEILLDDPIKSKGNNPDVIIKINNKKWGFGCKVLHSSKPLTIIDNIQKAVDQIENSVSDTGIPVISVKNIINHDEFWPMTMDDGKPLYYALSEGYCVSLLQNLTNRYQENFISQLGSENLLSIFSGKKAQPGCLLYIPTTASVVKNGSPITTRLNFFGLIQFREIDNECISILKNLNHVLQLVRS